jgi:hypothetical protein
MDQPQLVLLPADREKCFLVQVLSVKESVMEWREKITHVYANQIKPNPHFDEIRYKRADHHECCVRLCKEFELRAKDVAQHIRKQDVR